MDDKKWINERLCGLPPVLYKYRDWSDAYHRQILTANELFFSSARRFNDPFDCSIPIRFDLATRKQLTNSAKRVTKRLHGNWNRAQRRREYLARIREKGREGPDAWRQAEAEALDRFLGFGICALSAVPDNILMWSHYSKNHEGFCVGLDTERLLIWLYALLRKWGGEDRKSMFLDKVQYVRDFPVLDFWNEDRESVIERAILTKAQDWEYENEYRLIYTGGCDKVFKMDADIVSEVICGCKMSPQVRDEVRGKCASMTGIKLRHARKQRSSFAIEFVEDDLET